uniref:ANK_REP_REGION domain-containing protein n=1 Tax=Strongyloides stercoralis TaxID=6248 RepID=A0A0K0DTX1_STRER
MSPLASTGVMLPNSSEVRINNDNNSTPMSENASSDNNTINKDNDHAELLLSHCDDMHFSSQLCCFIHNDISGGDKKFIIVHDPLGVKPIIDLSLNHKDSVSKLLLCYKYPSTGKSSNMASSSPTDDNDSNALLERKNFFEYVCETIALTDDYTEFEKASKNPLFEDVVNNKDAGGRSLLSLACIINKPRIASLLIKKGLRIEDKDKHGRNSLFWSVKCESIKTVKWILNQLPMTDDLILSKDNKGITTIHVAAMKLSSKMLRLLLDSLSSKNEELMGKLFDDYGRMPLHYAAACGSLECVEEFMDESLYLPVSIRDIYGNTPLMLACGNTSASEVIRYLSTKKSISTTSRNCDGMSPLHIAVLANNIDGVKILLQECSVPTEIYDDDARTPLHYAAQNGRVEIVELLLEAGARYNATDDYGATPVHYAAETSWRIIEMISEKVGCRDFSLVDKQLRTPFMWAIAAENEEVTLQMLEEYNISRTRTDKKKYTALHIATLTGNPFFCKLLLERGWNIIAENEVGATPLHIAAGKGFTDLVRLFCISADVTRRVDTQLRSPLFYAVLGGQGHTLDVMVTRLGFSVRDEDVLERTVLHAAVCCGYINFVQKLIDYGADINAVDKDEEAPLHLACSRGRDDIVRLLVSSGAIVNAYSRVNEITPLNYALARNKIEIIEFLKENNAVTGEEIKHIAANTIKRAILRYIIRRQQLPSRYHLVPMPQSSEASTLTTTDSTESTDSSLSQRSSSKENLSQVVNTSSVNSQNNIYSVRSRSSSHSTSVNLFNDDNSLSNTNNI